MDVCYYINSNIDGNCLLALLILNSKILEKIKALFFLFFLRSRSCGCRFGQTFPPVYLIYQSAMKLIIFILIIFCLLLITDLPRQS